MISEKTLFFQIKKGSNIYFLTNNIYSIFAFSNFTPKTSFLQIPKISFGQSHFDKYSFIIYMKSLCLMPGFN